MIVGIKKKGQKYLNVKSAIICDIKTKSQHQLSIYESMTKTEFWDINNKNQKQFIKQLLNGQGLKNSWELLNHNI
ncbi:zinc finger BED domain-containing protein 4-like isoform X2, partial [Aphis craccivora]